jgi:hypothetical protein
MPIEHGEGRSDKKGTGYFLMEKLNAAGLARQQEREKGACPLFSILENGAIWLYILWDFRKEGLSWHWP